MVLVLAAGRAGSRRPLSGRPEHPRDAPGAFFYYIVTFLPYRGVRRRTIPDHTGLKRDWRGSDRDGALAGTGVEKELKENLESRMNIPIFVNNFEKERNEPTKMLIG